MSGLHFDSLDDCPPGLRKLLEKQEAKEKEMQEQNEREISELEQKRADLIKQYEELQTRRAQVAEGTENADNINDAIRFAKTQTDLGEQMDQLRQQALDIDSEIKSKKK